MVSWRKWLNAFPHIDVKPKPNYVKYFNQVIESCINHQLNKSSARAYYKKVKIEFEQGHKLMYVCTKSLIFFYFQILSSFPSPLPLPSLSIISIFILISICSLKYAGQQQLFGTSVILYIYLLSFLQFDNTTKHKSPCLRR